MLYTEIPSPNQRFMEKGITANFTNLRGLNQFLQPFQHLTLK